VICKEKKRSLNLEVFSPPDELISKMLLVLKEMQILPYTIVEPTCKLKTEIQNDKVEIINADIFEYVEGRKEKLDYTRSILFIGNPPWITSSKSRAMGANNLPKKSNINKLY